MAADALSALEQAGAAAGDFFLVALKALLALAVAVAVGLLVAAGVLVGQGVGQQVVAPAGYWRCTGTSSSS